MLLAPLYVGQRVHSPERKLRAYSGDPELIYDAKWSRLVSDDVFYTVRARLLDPSRTTTATRACRSTCSR